jgi:uncharacterized protein (DUF2147 family)
MRNPITLAATVIISSLTPQYAAAESTVDEAFVGTWKNPKNSVHVRTYACGKSLCGAVVWASEGQQSSARKAGSGQLIGKQMFNEFVLGDDRVWRGKVFVPKQNKHFPGTVTTVDINTMQVRGCAFGGMICKTQTWTRMKAAS